MFGRQITVMKQNIRSEYPLRDLFFYEAQVRPSTRETRGQSNWTKSDHGGPFSG